MQVNNAVLMRRKIAPIVGSILFVSLVLLPPFATGELVTYSYDNSTVLDGIGRLTRVTDDSGTTDFYYDIVNRVQQTTKTVDAIVYTTRTTFDPMGRVKP